jgi:hypothetical protein
MSHQHSCRQQGPIVSLLEEQWQRVNRRERTKGLRCSGGRPLLARFSPDRHRRPHRDGAFRPDPEHAPQPRARAQQRSGETPLRDRRAMRSANVRSRRARRFPSGSAPPGADGGAGAPRRRGADRAAFAPPERMFARLAPSSCSSPRPFECRRSSSAASVGWFVTIGRPCSFSHQRNAGQSSLLPCSSPAWRAPVCDDQSVSHRMRWCDPSAQPSAHQRHVAIA